MSVLVLAATGALAAAHSLLLLLMQLLLLTLSELCLEDLEWLPVASCLHSTTRLHVGALETEHVVLFLDWGHDLGDWEAESI